RAGGGAYERNHLRLFVFAADGLVTRVEMFDLEREDEAFARFDELTGEPAPVRVGAAPFSTMQKRQRRVRANAATANVTGYEAPLAARDFETCDPLAADDLEIVHHSTGTTYGRQGALASVRSLLRARDATIRYELLASLGDSLALCRQSISA